jgi:hypothetical protein
MVIGQCPVCSGWTLNPEPDARCSYCEGRVAPLGPLDRMEVPDGSRINVEGKVFGPDKALLFERKYPNPEKPDGPVAFVREYLRGYDEGVLTEGDVGYSLFAFGMDKVVDHFLKSQEPWFTVSSFCGDASKVPTETIKVTITRWGRDYKIHPID